MTIDKDKFNKFLTHTGHWQGGRCKDAVSSADGDVIAVAITMSTLGHLMCAAEAKPLYKHDIQIVMDAFLQSAGMTEEFHPMGGSEFRRITTETKDAT